MVQPDRHGGRDHTNRRDVITQVREADERRELGFGLGVEPLGLQQRGAVVDLDGRLEAIEADGNVEPRRLPPGGRHRLGSGPFLGVPYVTGSIRTIAKEDSKPSYSNSRSRPDSDKPEMMNAR